MSQSIASYSGYSSSSFLQKVMGSAKGMGRELLYIAFCLFYALDNPAMPLPLKLSVVASLAYLICPIDAIPDVIPVLGYTDDAGVLATTLATISSFIDDSVKAKARARANSLL